ncbi:MAG: putative TPR repeat methyltransferase, partial [Myxococcota bacterium]
TILATYEQVAVAFGRERSQTLFERSWLDRMLANIPPPRRCLDLGCGTGLPVARYLVEQRALVTGVDGAAAMLELFEANVPEATALHADMRALSLDGKFQGILAWNSFFHLSQSDQRGMFPIFAAHAAPGAVLMFTSGPKAGEVMGVAGGQPVYHSSLDPDDYRQLMDQNGFEVLQYVPEDPSCAGHTVWLARFRG